MVMIQRTSGGAERAGRWQTCRRPLAVGVCALVFEACFGSGGGGGASGSGSGGVGGSGSAGVSGGVSGGASGTAGTTGTAGATGIGGTPGGGGASGGGAGGGAAGAGGAAGTTTSSYDCTNCSLVCSLGSSSPCRDEYEGLCACATDAGMPDPNRLLECLNTLFASEAACVDACEPCCMDAGDDHGMCAPASPGPYRCTCWSDPTPRGCQATGCPDGQECCDGGIPCSPVCVPIGMGCGCDRDCDSPDTPIATPDGERPVAELREGDLVLSMQGGAVVAVPVVATRRHAVAARHAVVRVLLSSGRTIEISASHPTADGRTLGALVPGDRLGDARVDAVSMVPYAHAFTYDILPASDTASYFAAGALVGSTLARPGTAGTQ